ncbi:MAG: hypothetical protein ACE1Y4_11310, partial [Lysobacterales bacterium]
MSIYLSAFTQCSAALPSFGQWQHPEDHSSQGHTDVQFGIDLARTLERGCFGSLFFAALHGAE